MRLGLLAVLLMLLPLTACNALPIAANADLLVAPVLSREQAEVSEALGRIMDLADIVYKYPQGGDYRSSFVFIDLDGDGLQEVVIFYAYASTPSEIRAKILRQSQPGQWYSLQDIAGSGDAIDFVQFSPIFPSMQSMVIGWRNTVYQQTSLGVYTMRDILEQDMLERYSAQVMHDFDSDGHYEVVLTQREDDLHVIRLLRAQFGRLIEMDRYFLHEDTTAVAQMLRGRLWDSTTGLYVDEKIDNSFYGTEVFRINGRSLTPLSASALGTEMPAWSNFTTTFREENVLSVDLANDGAIEVPRVVWLPAAQDRGEIVLPPLTKYMRLEEDGFQVRFNAVINNDAGYMVFFPDSWLENVTLVESQEEKEWSFRKYDTESGQITTELFRIRVYSTEDYFDQSARSDILLASRGIFRYYGYVPALPDEPLAITQAQAQELFALLDSSN